MNKKGLMDLFAISRFECTIQMINLGEENVEEVGEKYENETFKDE